MLNNLGKFKIVSEVGHGAMGVVYRAEDNLGRSVALKVLPPRLAGDPDLVQRFNREARSAASLNHPNIVVIYESSQIDGTSYIAMEFIEGESLDQIISSRRAVSIVKRLDIIIQTCRGLQYAHKKQVVHRDIKPSNIMVDHDGTVKIVDFGIAHLGGGAMLTLTQDGQRLGTPSYMSPEQTQGKAVDGRSDIFSVGVMLFELLTYQKPFPGNDIASVWYKIQNEPPPPLSELLPTCPPDLEKAVNKALAKNREDRYHTAEDLGFALQQVSDYFKHDMIEVYVQEGRRHLEEGNLTVAKESIQRALEIDGTHEVARSLFDRVQGQIEARRRAQRVDHVLREAKEALQASQFDQAIALLDEALRLDPAREEARQYRTLAVQNRERFRKISQHMERAERLAADADLQGAKEALEAVLALDGEHPAAQSKLAWVLKELAEQERQRQVRQYTQDGKNYLAQKNFDQARESLEKALALDPINIEVEALLRQLRTAQQKEKERQRREGRLTGIQGALNTKDFDQAVSLAEQALEEFPGDPQVLKLHAQASRLAELEARRRYVEEQLRIARGFFQNDEYAEAVCVLERALVKVPNEVRLASYLKTVQLAQQQAAVESLRREAVRKAGALIREKKFAEAIAALEGALAQAGESPDILEVLQFAREQQSEQQKEEHIQQMLSWAQIDLREQNFEEALRVLELARRESSSAEIDALLDSAREQQQQFEQQRLEVMQQARRALEGGDPAAAAALLDAAPKAYFKNEVFRQLHAQCRAGLDRAASIRGAVAEVEKAAAEGSLDNAKKLLQQALRAYPNEAVLLAAQERLGAEEIRLQDTGWRKLIDQAKAAVGRLDYERAIGILASLLPELPKASELAAEARALQEQARQGARELALRKQAIQAANEHIRNNQLAPAVAILERASAEAGESPELAELLRLARGRRDERVRKAISEAQALLAEDAYAEAIGILEQSEKDLGTSEISVLLASARDQEREFGLRRQETLQEARRLLKAGDAVKAVALLDAAPKAYGKDEEYQGLYTQCREKLELAEFVSSTRAQVESCLESQDPVHAEAALQQALRRFPKEPAFLALQSRLEEGRSRLRRMAWTKLMEEASVALGRSDYERALDALKSLPPEVAEEPDLASTARTLQAKASQIERRIAARRQALDEAKACISATDFSTAIEILEKTEAGEGPSPELKELLEDARQRKTEQERQAGVRQLEAQVRQLQVKHNYEDALLMLKQAQSEWNAREIEALLAGVRERQRQFEEDQKKTLARVRKLLAAGDATKALVLLDSSPKAYFKKEEFTRIYAECKEQVARSAFVQSNLKQFDEYIGVQDFAQAEALLQRALQAYPQDAELLAARKRFEDARLRWQETEWSKVVDEARSALAHGTFQRAIDLLGPLQPDIRAIPELASQAAALFDEARQKEKTTGISRQAVRAAQEQLKQGEHLRAIETLERALAVAGSSREIDRLLKLAREQAEQAQQKRIRAVLEQARQLQKSSKYSEAVNLLEQARSEGGAKEIDSRLAAVREQLRLAQQRDEILQQARALLAAGNAAQALALLDGAPKAFHENAEFSRLYADCRETLDRANFISSNVARLEALLSNNDVAQARSLLNGALKKFPNEPALLAVQERLQQAESRVRGAERSKQVETARAALEQREYRKALEILKTLASDLSETPELVSVVPELLERARRMEQQALQRQQAIREATEQIRKNQYARAIATLEAAAKTGASAETDALLRSAQEGLRRERNGHRDQLLAIEQKISSSRKSKLEGLSRQVQQIAAGYGADDELASIAARVQQRIATGMAAPAPPRKPLPWRRLALGVAAAAVLVAGAELGLHLIRAPKPPEQTVPAKLGDKNQPAQVPRGVSETPRGQQLEAETGEPKFPTPNPPLQPAKSVGRQAGKPALPVAKGPTSQPTAQELPPGQTTTTSRPSVSPPVSPTPSEPTGPEATEARDWDRVHDTTDPDEVREFLNKYPHGSHRELAEKLLDDMEWKQVKSPQDVEALHKYQRDFPGGLHSDEAAQLLDDNAWSAVEKNNLQRVQEFIGRHQNSSHLPEAKSILSKLKSEQSEAQDVKKALQQFNTAFEHAQPQELRKIWPRATNTYLTAMRSRQGYSVVMVLRPTGPVQIDGDTALIQCELTSTTKEPGGQLRQPVKSSVNVRLHRASNGWIILDPFSAVDH